MRAPLQQVAAGGQTPGDFGHFPVSPRPRVSGPELLPGHWRRNFLKKFLRQNFRWRRSLRSCGMPSLHAMNSCHCVHPPVDGGSFHALFVLRLSSSVRRRAHGGRPEWLCPRPCLGRSVLTDSRGRPVLLPRPPGTYVPEPLEGHAIWGAALRRSMRSTSEVRRQPGARGVKPTFCPARAVRHRGSPPTAVVELHGAAPRACGQ